MLVFWGFFDFGLAANHTSDATTKSMATATGNDDDDDSTLTVTVNDYDYSYGYGYGCDYYATTVRHYGYGLFVVERITQLVRTELENGRQASRATYT